MQTFKSMRVYTYIFLVTLTATLQIAASQSLWKIFEKLEDTKSTKANNLISPSALQTSLAVAYFAAKGPTANQIKKNLDVAQKDKDEVAEHLSANQKDRTNNLFIRRKLKLNEQFEKRINRLNLKKKYVKMNERTKGSQIDKVLKKPHRDLIRSYDIDNTTVAIALSTVQVDYAWRNTYRMQRLPKMPFRNGSKSSTHLVSMMSHVDVLRYGQFRQGDAVAVEIPLQGENTRLLLLLPRQVKGLNKLKKSLNIKKLHTISKSLKKKSVNLSLPSFKVKFRGSLRAALLQVGVTRGLSDKANFEDLLNSRVGGKLLQSYIHDFKQSTTIQIGIRGVNVSTATIVQWQQSYRVKKSLHDEDNDVDAGDDEIPDENSADDELPNENTADDELPNENSADDELPNENTADDELPNENSADDENSTDADTNESNDEIVDDNNDTDNEIYKSKKSLKPKKTEKKKLDAIVKVDHPFFYAVMNDATPLLMGTIVNIKK